MEPDRHDPESLVEHVEGVRRLARHLVRDADAAEDVAQEALAQGLRAAPRKGWGLGAWLRGVVRNKARERARSEARRRKHEPCAPARPEVPSAADVAGRVEIHKRVLDAVLALPEPYRAVVWMRYFEDRSPRGIAQLLGVPRETARTHLRRGIERLRAALDADPRASEGGWRSSLLPLLRPSWNALPHLLPEGVAMAIPSKVVAAAAAVAVLGLGVGGLGSGWLEDRHAPVDAGAGAQAPVGAPSAEGPRLVGAGRPSPAEAPEAQLPPIDLGSVDRARDLHGVVRRRDGSPVAGATLRALRCRWRHGGLFTLRSDRETVARTRSSSDGSYALRLEPGAVVNLEVVAVGLATAVFGGLNAGERFEAVLAPGVDVRVEVRDDAGRPVPACAVRLFRSGSDLGGLVVELEASTDAAGTAAFPGLVGGVTLTLEAKAPDLGDSGWTEVVVPAEGPTRLTVVLPAGRTVTGVVVDAVTQAPIAGAQVGANWTCSHPVTTDAAGRYTYRGWTGRGTSVLTATAPGYARLWQGVGPGASLDFALAPGARVTGHVVDGADRPVAGAIVSGSSVAGSESDGASAFPSTTTDAAGAFVLEGVLRARDLGFAVQADGLAAHAERIPSARYEGGALDLGTIRLGSERTLAGVVVDAEGAPLGRISVFAQGLGAGADPKDRWNRETGLYGAGGGRFTDDLGRFVVRGLSPGAYRVVARPPGQDEVMAVADLRAQGDSEDLRLVVPDTRELEVEAVTSEGAPIEGLRVSLQGSQPSLGGGVTDARGRATVHCTADVRYVSLGFPPGTFDRYAPTGPPVHELRPDERSVRFVLDVCEPTVGRVVDETSHPVVGVHVGVVGLDGVHRNARATDEAGVFRVPVPTGRTAGLVVDGTGERRVGSGTGKTVTDLGVEGRVDGVRAGATDVVLRVRTRSAERVLDVRVLRPDGTPAVGFPVTASITTMASVSGSTDEQGSVRLEGLPDRPVDVRIDLPREGRRAGEPLVGETLQGVLPGGGLLMRTLSAPVRVMGSVTDEHAAGLVGVEVTLRTPDGPRRVGKTGAGGRFAFFVHPRDAFPLDLDVAHTTPTGALLLGSVRALAAPSDDVAIVLRRVVRPASR